MSTNPFATKEPEAVAPEAPAAAPAAPAAAPAAAAAAPVVEGKKKDRKKPNKQASMAQKQFVIANYATMSRSDIADASDVDGTGNPLTGQQVYNVIKAVRDAGNARAADLRENGDEAAAAVIEAKLAAAFPKKMTGGKGGGRKKGTDVNALLDELLG